MSLTSIVAVGLDGAIGIENRLPWQLKSDLKFFKATTKGNIVIMGRKTYESIGGCLPLRENIVLSHTPQLFPKHEGCSHVHSIGETLSLRMSWPSKDAFVIGGAQTYKQFAPLVDRYLLTIVNARFPEADAFFDQAIIGDESVWTKKLIEVERVEKDGADEFDFQVFELTHKFPDQVAASRQEIVAAFREKNHFFRRKELRKVASAGLGLEELRSFA